MKIAVYCSSVENLPASWVEGAVVTGRWIAEHGAQLVYGGVDAGLMTDTARACKEAGGTVVGVV
ncbi:MAG: TIGR00730 family Rossman fold protein, partial [Muribaculaceae bacterium]|nr:TIGR00730 family Rossman fold protein [Muribaculaceae bacterium]